MENGQKLCNIQTRDSWAAGAAAGGQQGAQPGGHPGVHHRHLPRAPHPQVRHHPVITVTKEM